MTKEEINLRIKSLETEVEYSLKVLGYLSGNLKSIYEGWVDLKKDELNILKNENKNNTCEEKLLDC